MQQATRSSAGRVRVSAANGRTYQNPETKRSDTFWMPPPEDEAVSVSHSAAWGATLSRSATTACGEGGGR